MKLSLIIPVHNKKPFLKRCFNSIASQTKESVEVIVIDDHSTDGSSKICDEYEGKGFKVWHFDKKGGVSKARNFGLEVAQGEYMWFVDADDSLKSNAIRTALQYLSLGFNIIQFNHSRFISGPDLPPTTRMTVAGHSSMARTQKYWQLVWNKVYKKSFLDDNRIRFIEDMQFGEDELFNVECMILNNDVYHVSDVLYNHYFDDTSSLCRGELDLERIKGLDKALKDRLLEAKSVNDGDAVAWLTKVITRHHNSATFNKFGFNRGEKGKYDIVYFVKDCTINEELRYSLRSVERNFKYRDVWFYGGCPVNLKPDHHVAVTQNEPSKWERVRGMMMKACENDNLTDDFWLFNDDFFILRPVPEDIPPYYNGSIYKQIVKVENRHGMTSNDYTRRLRHLTETLEKAGKDCKNYGVHKPMLINRKKMLEVLKMFPDEPMNRALYGNYWNVGGVRRKDMKIRVNSYPHMDEVKTQWDFVSTSDDSFREGEIGRYIRDKFKVKSRFEI